MNRNIYLRVSSLLLVGGLLGSMVVGCTKPAPELPVTPSPAPAAPKQVVLKMQLWRAPTHFTSVATREMLPELEQMTGGRVKIDYYDSESLVKSAENLEAVQSGQIDIADLLISPYVKTIPSLGFMDLPFVFNDAAGMMDAFTKGGLGQEVETVIRKTGYSQTKLIGTYYGGFGYFSATKKLLKVPADAKGLKFRCAGGGPIMDYAKQLDISIVQLPASETYDALAKGVVDGALLSPTGYVSWKFMEPLGYFLDMPFVAYAYFWAVRQATLDSLPDDLRGAVVSWLRELSYRLNGEYMLVDVANFSIMRQYMEFYAPSSEEVKLWKAPAQGIVDKWTADTGAEGKKMIEIIRKYNP